MGKVAGKAAKRAAVRKLVSTRPSVRAPIKKDVRPRSSSGNGSVPVKKERFTLHGFALSGPTYTVALMLNLGVGVEKNSAEARRFVEVPLAENR